ncbi:MAG: 30S ribosomal protein S17 [Candidatus Woesearchaeota archaeon]|nr:MAG: 30S ribosomal protein S17 [Candidatus Woesearchaeota archaeon]
MKEKKSIGIEADFPKQGCNDTKCPFHGTLKIRGRTFVGKVTSAKATKTVKVEFERLFNLPKYERSEKRRTRIHAHNTPCITVKEGDKVMIAECRPLSKTKKFVVVEVLNESNKG